jgi:serine/threonine protein kinase
MLGQTVSHYKIVDHLGGGGMGIVYKAEDTRLKRAVALKFLSADLTRDPDAKARFIHEARAASALDHPNIGAIYEIDQTQEGQIFIAMAFYDGMTLKQKIGAESLEITACIDLAVQIAQGLAHAHKFGIVHRDIKPANIMVTQENLLKIVDFGLAKLAGGTIITQVGTTMGTPVYMSPEQIRGLEVDHRTDIWAFGVVLYEMLAGQLPFRGEQQQAVFYAILNQEPAPVSQLNASVPVELEQVVRKALQKKLENRYATMQAMLDELKRIQRQISKMQKRPRSETQTHSEVATLLEKGKYYLERREYNDAVTRFKAVLQLNPANREARDLITVCEFKQNEAQQVAKLLNNGKRYFEKGDYNEATKTFQEVITIDPEQPEAKEFLTKMQQLAEQAEQVEKLLVEADFYFKREKVEQAYEIYKKILKQAPDNKEALRGLQKAEKALATSRPESQRTLRTGPISAPKKSSGKAVRIGLAIFAIVAIAAVFLLTRRPEAPEPKRPAGLAAADSAKRMMQQLKTIAQQTGADKWASETFQLALQAEQNGDQAYRAANYQAAGVAYDKAGTQFKSAREEAINAASVDEKKRQDAATELQRAMLRKDAETARSDMAFIKGRVPTNAKNTANYRQAASIETAGEKQFNKGEFRAARQSFEQAKSYYRQATSAAPVAGTLAVSSAPSGAQIFLNGEATGRTTPFERANLKVGPYRIRLALAGYADTTITAVVSAAQTQRMQINLRRLQLGPGRLNVNAVVLDNGREKPAAAVVLINGQAQDGETPRVFNLAAGKYRISAKYVGHVLQSGEQEIALRSGETTKVKFIFVKQ